MGLPTPEAVDAVKFAERTQELLTIYPTNLPSTAQPAG